MEEFLPPEFFLATSLFAAPLPSVLSMAELPEFRLNLSSLPELRVDPVLTLSGLSVDPAELRLSRPSLPKEFPELNRPLPDEKLNRCSLLLGDVTSRLP